MPLVELFLFMSKRFSPKILYDMIVRHIEHPGRCGDATPQQSFFSHFSLSVGLCPAPGSPFGVRRFCKQ